MLAGVVRGLVREGRPVAVVARKRVGITALAASCADPELVVPVPCDYADPVGLRSSLAKVSGDRGPFTLVVCWIHSPHHDAVHEAIAPYVSERARVLDVLGSGAADPARAAADGVIRPSHYRSSRLRYQRAILGFTDGPSGIRWLSHEEIGSGVLAATHGTRETTVVGRVRPWSDRP